MDPRDSVHSKTEIDIQKKKHNCTVEGCMARFSKKRKLINHLRRHNGERPFACDEPGCSKNYTNSSHLLRHKKSSHAKQATLYVCKVENCGLMLTTKWNLKKHICNKHSIRGIVFTCAECSKDFRKKRHLQEHLYTHTGVAPFICDLCEGGYVTFRDYSKHKRNHSIYSCSCGEEFILWSKLRKHKESCKKELTCETCSKIFSSKTNLRQHQMIHNEKKTQFKCEFETCNRSYDYKRNLVHHVKTFHGKRDEIEKIPCSFDGCLKLFKSQLYLRRHLISQHKQMKQKSKTKRNPRFDKGQPTQSMASILSGINLSVKENKAVIRGEIVIPKEISCGIENKESNMGMSSCEQNKTTELIDEENHSICPDLSPTPVLEEVNSKEISKYTDDNENTLNNKPEKTCKLVDHIPFSDGVIQSYCDATLAVLEDSIQDVKDSEDLSSNRDVLTSAENGLVCV